MLTKKMGLSWLVGCVVVVAILACPLGYYASSFVGRLVLFVSFFTLLSLLVLIYKTHYFGLKTVYSLLLAISVMFALYSYNFLSAQFVESRSNNQDYTNAGLFSQTGHIAFLVPHSYFFLWSEIVSFLNTICGLPLSSVVYINFLVDVTFTALVSILIFRLVKKKIDAYSSKSALFNILPPLIAVLSISFANSTRGGFAFVLFFLLFWLIFDGRYKNRSNQVLLIILVLAITWGSTVGALFLIPFFFIASIFSTRNKLFYSFIPLSYMIYAATSYVLSIKGFATSAWTGFTIFFQNLLAGQFPNRTLPWNRGSISPPGDSYITSAAFLSLFLLALLTALILTFSREKAQKTSSYPENFKLASFKSAVICVWFFLGIVAITYFGTVAVQETSSSDIRTIAAVFITLALPFFFSSDKLLKKINKKAILLILITLVLIASLSSIYQVQTKSINDPISVVEDARLEPFSVYYTGDFLGSYINGTSAQVAYLNATVPPTIICDYKTRLNLQPDFVNELNFIEFSGSIFPSVSGSYFLMFDNNGLRFGSLYDSPANYETANNLTENQSIIYTSGNITIVYVR
jgi:hypothetical protein